MSWTVIQGDARHIPLAAESVNTIVTSPPYWGLRDYGIKPTIWGGASECAHAFGDGIVRNLRGKVGDKSTIDGDQDRAGERPQCVSQGSFCRCGAWYGCLGLEPTPELYVAHIVEIARELSRVLRKDGTLWLNLGDSYIHGAGADRKPTTLAGARVPASWSNRSQPQRIRSAFGLRSKNLLGMPWRVAFALQAAGWWLRCDIIWAKPNPMPESITDRPTKAHEYIFLLTKSERYFYDQEAVLEDVSPNTHARLTQDLSNQIGSYRANGGGKTNGPMKAVGRKAAAAEIGVVKHNASFDASVCMPVAKRNSRSVWFVPTQSFSEAHFATFPEEIAERCIKAGSPKGGVVLDPFGGAGTTALVADKLGRRGISLELKADYCRMARERIYRDAPLLAHAEENRS